MAELRYHKYQEFARALKERHLVYNKSLKEIHRLEEAGEVFVIQP